MMLMEWRLHVPAKDGAGDVPPSIWHVGLREFERLVVSCVQREDADKRAAVDTITLLRAITLKGAFPLPSGDIERRSLPTSVIHDITAPPHENCRH